MVRLSQERRAIASSNGLPKALFLLPLSQPYAGAATILVDELNPRQLKRPSKHRKNSVTRLRRFTLK